METNAIITFFICIIAIVIFGKFILHFKNILKIAINSILGGEREVLRVSFGQFIIQ